MPLIELDDAVLARLQAEQIPYHDRTAQHKEATDYQKMLWEIRQGPNALELLRVMKKQYPHLSIPEIDAAKPVMDEVERVRQEFQEYVKTAEEKAVKDAEERKAQAEKDAEERKLAAEDKRKESANTTIAQGRKWLKEQGCDDEGVAAVEKIMQDENLANYDRAFKIFRSEQPAPAALPPSPYGGTALDWFRPAEGDADHKLLAENPVAFKDAAVKKFFVERAEGRLRQ